MHTHVLPLRHREFHVSVHLLVLFHPSENFNLFRGRYQSGLVSISQFVTGLRRRIFNRVPIPSFDPLPRRFLLVPETKSCVGPPLWKICRDATPSQRPTDLLARQHSNNSPRIELKIKRTLEQKFPSAPTKLSKPNIENVISRCPDVGPFPTLSNCPTTFLPAFPISLHRPPLYYRSTLHAFLPFSLSLSSRCFSPSFSLTVVRAVDVYTHRRIRVLHVRTIDSSPSISTLFLLSAATPVTVNNCVNSLRGYATDLQAEN